METGRVILVGAGPGDPELLTVKAARAIASADIVVYDRLVSSEILALVPAEAIKVNVGKAAGSHPIPQDSINQLLISLAHSDRTVVRLKGGDPFIFGRGFEEAQELDRAGIPYEVIPGITAAQGCAASAGIPLTHRGAATGVRYVTGHCRENAPLDLNWASLADPNTTLVVYMGHINVSEIACELIVHGLPANTPVLAVCQGTTPRERRICAPLMALPQAMRDSNFEGPILFVIGRVAALAAEWNEHDAVFRRETATVA